MKLKQLDLKAFGPFTERIIDFNDADPGLHIIFGHNEAGKSSSLRALKALLYGFHRQTPDDFIHHYKKLRVGGCLVNHAGEEIFFYRLKKRIGDIVDPDGNSLAPDVLTPFMHGVGPEIFESLYGIDHDALVQGGRDILDQKGEVGQALFSAGAGISSLGHVIEQLEKEAGALFKPAGKNPLINQAVRRFNILRKEVRTASLSIRDWKAHRKALANAEQERATLENQRALKLKELQRLERLEQAVPELAALASRKAQLTALGDVIALNPEFAQTHQAVNREIREAKQQLEREAVRLEKLKEKRDTIRLNRALLTQAGQVDDFHQRLGEYRKGQVDRPERNGMRITHRKEAANLLKQVRPDLTLSQVERLRPVLSRKRTVQTLISRYETIQHKLDQARKQSDAAKQEHEEVSKKISDFPKPKSSEDLLQAVKLARKMGEIDAQIEQDLEDIDAIKQDSMALIKRIGLWTGDLASLMALALPLSETVNHYNLLFGAVDDERRRLERERRKDAGALTSSRAELKQMSYAGAVPSEEALIRSRDQRTLGWQLIRRQWLDQEDVAEESRRYDPHRTLAEAYEGHVEEADTIADRLRREADRVAHAAALGAKIDSLEQSLGDNDRELAQLNKQDQENQTAWVAEWQPAGISPRTPKEMSGWLAEVDKIRFRVEEMLRKERTLVSDRQRRKHLREKIENALHLMEEEKVHEGETIGPVLMLAEAVLTKTDRLRTEIEKLTERQAQSEMSMHQADQDIASAEQTFAAWQAQWRKALSELTMESDVDPTEAIDQMDILQGCFDNLRAAEDLQKRIDGIDRDADILEREVQGMVVEVAPDLKTLPPDQIILKLRAMIDQAQKDSTLYDDITEEIDTVSQDIETIRNTLKNAQEQMDELLRSAQCEDPEKLPAVIGKFVEFQRLQEKISDTEAVLAKIGAGVSIESLSMQAAQLDADDLPELIGALKRDIRERINPEINKASQIIGEETNRLADMDGSARAADMAAEMEQELATIRRFADQYALLKLASRILQQEIERYREEHQDPVLKLASEYFKDMTLGSFIGLRTDVDDKGHPVLVGERPDASRLTVESMSSGTRDQLFLALRLATVEWRLETSEPMPFIVDDILINFDDERSKATLKALARLSKKNQVILFTHHQQIVAAAKGIDGKGAIQIHQL